MSKAILVRDSSKISNAVEKILDKRGIPHSSLFSEPTGKSLPYLIDSSGVYNGLYGINNFAKMKHR